jgi:hypothetical protein
MKILAGAAAAALVFACLAGAARATCVISPDGKSIDVVTDNGATDEKNCAVKCRVDTKIGIAQVSCGGNAPPLAKAFSLCNFDKPEPYYKRVLSFEDSCKPTPASATAPAAPAPLPKAASPDRPSFTCRVSADGLSVDAVVANPYPQDTQCSIDCQLSATGRGATYSVSCSRTASAGGVETVLCTQKSDKGKLVKMLQGKASCVKPLAANADPADKTDKDDDDMPDQDEILKRMQRGEPMQNWMKKK